MYDTTINKFLAVSILLDMCIPYADSAGESERIILVLDNISRVNYEYLNIYNTKKKVFEIEKIAEAYTSKYREQFGAIANENARAFLTICINSISQCISDFDSKTYKYMAKPYKELKQRGKGFKLTAMQVDFAKELYLSINKASKLLIKRVEVEKI